MLISLSFDIKAIDYNVCGCKNFNNSNYDKFIENFTKIPSRHSIIRQSTANRVIDNHFFNINLQIHLNHFFYYDYYQNQNLLSINDFVLEHLQASDLIFHFLYLVQFKFIIEIYDKTYTIKMHSVLLFLSIVWFRPRSFTTFHFSLSYFVCRVYF